MKRKLDLNETGYRLAACIGILFLISGVFSLGLLLIRLPEFVTRLIFYCKWVSLAAGVIGLASLIALIVIEAIQDSTYDTWYRKNQRKKLPAPGGYYECQYCGSRRVQAHDQQCPVCGKNFTPN